MADVLNPQFLSYFKVVLVGLFIYVVIFALLKNIKIFGEDDKINSLIALLSAVIVSFSGGVATYVVGYQINWFFIIFFPIFLLVVLLMFLGVKMSDITGQVTKNGKTIVVVFLVLFAIIFIKGFFALNNQFDVSNPPDDVYDVDASFNTGIDDVTNSQIEVNNKGVWNWFEDVFDSDLFAAAIFLIVIGGVVLFVTS